VSGTLRRDAGGTLTPVAAGKVQVTVTAPGTSTATVLGTATTDGAGAWSLTVSPAAGGSLAAVFAAVAGQPAARTVVGDLVVASWTTTTTLTTSTASVAQGVPVTATGLVTRTGGGTTQPAPAVAVKVYLQPAVGGAEVLVGSSTTRADGTYTVAARPTENGVLRTRVVAVPGHQDSASPTRAVTVAAGVSATPSTRTPRVGVAFTVRTAVVPAQAAAVRLERSVAGGAWTQVQTATTSSAGAWTFSVTPVTTGSVSYRVSVGATARNAAATSTETAVTVGP
jgi:5-hydroxyisourate hydrolase-like protein (transthyretin family)